MNEIEFLRFIDTQLENLKMDVLYWTTKSKLIEIIEDIRNGIRWQLEEEGA